VFILFYNIIFLISFGIKPKNLEDALAVGLKFLLSPEVPKMIPLFAHRFIPADPLDEGCFYDIFFYVFNLDNPVFSVMQTDVICYGRNLLHYIYNEIFDFTPCKYVYCIKKKWNVFFL
jgi:hypothetical protein